MTEADIVSAYGAQNAARIAEAQRQAPAGKRAVECDTNGPKRAHGEHRAALGTVAAAAVKNTAPETAPELVLTPPPDAKAARRNAKAEWLEQVAYFRRVNACLDPAALAEGLFVALPDWPGADMIYAVTNSNVAGKAIGGQLKAAGLRRGFPDINVDVARGRYCGLRLELKQPAGVLSDVDDHQAHWHERLRDQGYRVGVSFGWREAWVLTCDYLGWENNNG